VQKARGDEVEKLLTGKPAKPWPPKRVGQGPAAPGLYTSNYNMLGTFSYKGREHVRGTTLSLVVVTVLIFVFALAPLGGCSDSEDEGSSNAPSTTAQSAETTGQPEEAAVENVVVRVSGTPGTAYSGSYGTFQGAQAVDDTLGIGPADYEIEGSVSDILAAVFRKTQPADEGSLRVEILVDREVVAEDETSEEIGVINVTWSPQTGQIERRGPLD
jgi:hypothetical protein